MLRTLVLCLTLVVVLASTFRSVQAEPSPGCGGPRIGVETCVAPGAVPAPRVPDKPGCHACILSAGIVVAPPAATEIAADRTAAAGHAPGRSVRPDDRPPRG
ncbi:hypothetical protein [Pseudooceanicola sp. LIPI14-2-Ac024]|uniref:hypothetical protein n=1 Tax=Pseudooceanicola sp. LIPI14-2-Ac024 TaxID=3344875 RepID=UPI0035D12632